MEKIKNIQRDQWIFTCCLEPKQFDSFRKRDPSSYTKSAFSETEWDIFINYDNFITVEGSHHFVKNCSCKPISEAYALWFIKNECWNIYYKLQDQNIENIWECYEEEIKKLCMRDSITYEGY